MDDVYRINVAKTVFREAYAAGDVDKVLSVFSPGGFTDMSEALPSKFGEEALHEFRRRTELLFAEYSVKLSVIIIDIAILGSTAYDFGWHEWTITPKSGGQPLQNRHRYFELWARDGALGWKIALFVNNLDVREVVGESRSRWFLSDERRSPMISGAPAN